MVVVVVDRCVMKVGGVWGLLVKFSGGGVGERVGDKVKGFVSEELFF